MEIDQIFQDYFHQYQLLQPQYPFFQQIFFDTSQNLNRIPIL